jgi:hypothetical protein
MGWDEVRVWMNNAARVAAGAIAPPAHSPGAVAVSGIRSILPGSGSFSQELDRYNRDAAPSPLYSPTSRFGSVVTDPAQPLQASAGERERQMQMTMQMPMMGPTAYHGSPHVFDKFSMQKIGTGEGAQAYGHGLYFSAEPKIAEGYRRQLAGRTEPDVRIKGFSIDPADANLRVNLPGQTGVGHEALDALRKELVEFRIGATKDAQLDRALMMARVKAEEDAKYFAKWAKDAEGFGNAKGAADYTERARQAAKAAEDLQTLSVSDLEAVPWQDKGTFHEVDIPDNLLDFEKPLREQAPEIQEAVQKLKPGRDVVAYKGVPIERLDKQHDPLRRKLFNSIRTFDGDPEKFRSYAAGIRPGATLGREALEQLAEMDRLLAEGKLARKTIPWGEFDTGSTVYRELGPQKEASAKLRAAGIPGHAYTGDSSGVTNYVVYDDAVIKPKGRWSSLQEWLAAKGATP